MRGDLDIEGNLYYALDHFGADGIIFYGSESFKRVIFTIDWQHCRI